MSQPRSINALPLAVMAIALLAGCTTNKDKLLPHGEETMMDVWQQGAPGGQAAQAADKCSMHGYN